MIETVGARLGCEDEVFLSNVTEAYEADGDKIGPAASLAIRGIKRVFRDLRSSGDDYDTLTLDAIDASFFITDELGYADEQPDGFEFGRRLSARILRANRRQIVDFAYWYSDRVALLGRKLEADQPRLAADALERTELLVASGLLPKTALKLMPQVAEWAGSFQPIGSVEQAANSNIGYCHNEGIGMANLYMLPSFPDCIGIELKQTTFHEYLHGVGQIYNEKRGLFSGLLVKQRRTPNRWLEEAYVSEIAIEAAKLGANKFAQAAIHQSYAAERAFLQLALESSPAPVDLSDLSEAHFSARQRNAKARLYVAKALSNGLNELYPEFEGNAWQSINEAYRDSERRDLRTIYMTALIALGRSRLSANMNHGFVSEDAS